MLNTIAIYDITSSTSTGNIYSRKQSASKDNNLGFFAASPLSYLEKSILPSLRYKNSDDVIHFEMKENTYYYACKRPNDTFMMAICSDRKLMPTEAYHLFANMRHAHTRPTLVKLDEIIANPLGFTGNDKLMLHAQIELDGLKRIMISNIDKVLDRHEKLENLDVKAEELKLQSIKFKNGAEKLNNHCCGMF